MENNWKWYEQQNPQQNAQQSEQPQQSQPNYGQYNYSTNANPGYNAYGAGNGGSGNGSKPKKFVTMTQMIVTVIVAALLFTGAGLAIGRGISANNEPTKQEVLSNATTAPEQNNTANAPTVTQDPATQPSSGIKTNDSRAEGDGSTSVVQSSMSSVVSIDIEAEVSTGRYWYSNGETESETVGSGSGVILTSDGYIVTNNHVVFGADKIKVYLQDGTEYEAQLIGADSYTDLAVIKIDAENLPAATVGSSSSLMVGDTIYAIGNPLGVLATSVPKGIVSGLDREVTIDGQQMTLMQVNASVNPGNSGGGLFNANGELIGIVNAKSSSSDAEGLGFAIPINTAMEMAKQMIEKGYVARPAMGVTVITINDAQTAMQYGVSNYGVYIYQIASGSGAEKGGLKLGDRIISIDDVAVSSASDVQKYCQSKEVGDTVTLQVERDGKVISCEVTLGESTQSTATAESGN